MYGLTVTTENFDLCSVGWMETTSLTLQCGLKLREEEDPSSSISQVLEHQEVWHLTVLLQSEQRVSSVRWLHEKFQS